MGKSKNSKIDVTVAVPTYNGEEHLDDLIKGVLSQKTNLKFELLIIDSGSTDKSLDIIKKYSEIKLYEIPNYEFGHGKTRNLAAEKSGAEYIVYLSQDAIPADNKWLDSMVEPFNLNEKVFCVLGKQTPRKLTDATTKREVSSVFNSLGPDHSIMLHRGRSLLDSSDISPKLTFFSDVNSAVRLSYLKKKIKYRDVEYSEDQLLGSDVLNAGYLKAYAPSGNVIHSNDYVLNKYFARRIDEYTAMYKVMGVIPEGRIPSLFKILLKESYNDFIFIFKDRDYSFRLKIKNLFESPFRELGKVRASYVVYRNLENLSNLDKLSLEKNNK